MQGVRNVLIVGAGVLGQQVEKYVESHSASRRSVCGFLDDEKPLGDGVIGRTNELARVARTKFIDEIIITAPHDRDVMLRLVSEAKRLHLDVKVAADLLGCDSSRTEVLGSIPLLALHEERIPVAGLLFKRILDIGLGASALILLAPVFALIAALIKLDSRGPALYIAPRAGLKGRPFRCYKFRTMVPEADEIKTTLRARNQREGPFFKIKEDPRISRVGRFLRRYSLDELPQLWNVLKGDMSLVGPRPHPLDDFSGYAIEHLQRLDVTPGITGLWQVTARTDPSFETGLNLDLEYIGSWSLRKDLGILWKTAEAVLHGSGE